MGYFFLLFFNAEVVQINIKFDKWIKTDGIKCPEISFMKDTIVAYTLRVCEYIYVQHSIHACTLPTFIETWLKL